MEDLLRIGELGARHGLTTATLRYYERLGLLGEPERSHSGYRLFSREDDERLRFILRAKALDLTLEEIKSLLQVRHEGRCGEARTNLRHLVAHKIREARTRAREAEAFATQLTHVYDRLGEEEVLDGSENCACIPELPDTALALEAELALIEHSVCDCGGRLDGDAACACGCCAPNGAVDGPRGLGGVTIDVGLPTQNLRGGDDTLSNDTLTILGSEEGTATCACCSPATSAVASDEEAPVSSCGCGSGSSEGCGPDCSCGA